MQGYSRKSSSPSARCRKLSSVGKENTGLPASIIKRARVAGIRNKLRKSGQSNTSRRPLQELQVAVDVAASTSPQSPRKENNMKRIRKVQGDIEARMRMFETTVRMVKNNVEGIRKEFDELSDEIGRLQEYYEALDDNYHNALASIEEEKKTVEHYRGALANADVQIKHLELAVPARLNFPLHFLKPNQANGSCPIYCLPNVDAGMTGRIMASS
ncbi:hypothetical protein NMY22_g396 [Coprinellus aureogranulatus]|nr:hypothetical protein NMY22_g396 [Coprinellus aureogranulatus]